MAFINYQYSVQYLGTSSKKGAKFTSYDEPLNHCQLDSLSDKRVGHCRTFAEGHYSRTGQLKCFTSENVPKCTWFVLTENILYCIRQRPIKAYRKRLLMVIF